MDLEKLTNETNETLRQYRVSKEIKASLLLIITEAFQDGYLEGFTTAQSYKKISKEEYGKTLSQIKNERYLRKTATIIPCPECGKERPVRKTQNPDSPCKSCNGKIRGLANIKEGKAVNKPKAERKPKKKYKCTECKEELTRTVAPAQPFVCGNCKKTQAKAKKIRLREAIEKPKERTSAKKDFERRDYTPKEADMIAQFKAKQAQ